MKQQVVILTTEFPPQPGGIGNHAYNLATQLVAHGYLVSVIADYRSTNKKEEQVFDAQQPFKVIRIPRRKFLLITYIRRIETAYRESLKANHFIASGKFSLWAGGLISWFSSINMLAVVHGSELLLSNKLLQKLTYFSLKRFHHLIAVSHYTASLVAHLVLKDKLHVINNGFQTPDVKIATDTSLDTINLITVGNLTPRKGQHNVIKLLPELKKLYPNIQYHLVGLPTQKNELKNIAHSLEVTENVVFHGRVEEARKWELLAQNNCFVMLSEADEKGAVEGFGIAILEANAMGLPAIGSSDCGIEDAIKDGYSGKLVTLNKPQQFIEALHEIIANYEVYSKNAKDWSQRFTWDLVIKEYIKVLENNN